MLNSEIGDEFKNELQELGTGSVGLFYLDVYKRQVLENLKKYPMDQFSMHRH